MILRILRGRAQRDDLGRLLEAMHADVEAWAPIAAGPLSFQPAYRELEDGIEFLLVSTWSDAEAVIALGGEITRPRGRLAESGLLDAAGAQHYELMMGMAAEGAGEGQVLRLSSIALEPRRSSAFYAHLRDLWQELVGDAGLVALYAGRRTNEAAEDAVVASVWESEAALEAATDGGYIGGDRMGAFYAAEPTIHHFTALPRHRAEPTA